MHIRNKIKPFTYLGSKFSYLPWLLPLLPECTHFVEPFGGSGVVLLNRSISPIETYNDINGNVVNFFKVLRDHPDELLNTLSLTPYSKKEYDNCWDLRTTNEIEKARRFFVRTEQSLWAAGCHDKSKGWAISVKESRRGISEKVNKWLNSIDNLSYVVNRLKNIQIENRDFRFIMRTYDDEGTLFYIDSPYYKTYRSNTKYEFEFTNQDFYDLLACCKKLKGRVAISGYNDQFTTQLFREFNFHMGPTRKNTRSNKNNINECLWTNY